MTEWNSRGAKENFWRLGDLRSTANAFYILKSNPIFNFDRIVWGLKVLVSHGRCCIYLFVDIPNIRSKKLVLFGRPRAHSLKEYPTMIYDRNLGEAGKYARVKRNAGS